MMGGGQSNMSSSSRREKTKGVVAHEVQVEQGPSHLREDQAASQSDPRGQISRQHQQTPAEQGQPATAAEGGAHRSTTLERTEKYSNTPSIAEVAEQHQSGGTREGNAPSVAEMAESLVGGGEPIPSSGPSKGIASRSVAEQADIDREVTNRQKHQDKLESEMPAYRKEPEPTGGREPELRQDVGKKLQQQEPGLSELLAIGGKPYTEERFAGGERMSSGQRGYQRYESSGEPVTPSAPSEKQLELGQIGASEQQRPKGLAQGQTKEHGDQSLPFPTGEESKSRERFLPGEQIRFGQQGYQRFESSGEPVTSSAPSETELGVGQAGALEQQYQQQQPQQKYQQRYPSGLDQERAKGQSQPLPMGEQSSSLERMGSQERARSQQQGYQRFERSGEPVPRSTPSEIEQGVGQEGQGQFKQQHPGGQSKQEGERGELSPEAGQAVFLVGPVQQEETSVGKETPIAGESEQASQTQGESMIPGETAGLQADKGRQPSMPNEQPGSESEKMPSARGPGPRQFQGQPGLSEGSESSISQGEEAAQLFYAQGEGYKGTPELTKQQAPFRKAQGYKVPEMTQQHQPSSHEAHSQTATYERSHPPRDRPQRLRENEMPGQASAELRSTTGQGGRFGREDLSAVPASVRSKEVPQSNISGLAGDLAQMQCPSEGSDEPPEKSSKSEKEQPPFTAFESGKEHIGMGFESQRPVEYEYLPHPADVQFHSWGSTKMKAFEHMADCMFNYLANTEKVDINGRYDFDFEVVGEDDKELLYKFLDELLFRFNTRKQIICKRVSINNMGANAAGYRLHAIGHGEPYNAEKHGSGTEIKAITLASLQVDERPGRTDAYVIVDI